MHIVALTVAEKVLFLSPLINNHFPFSYHLCNKAMITASFLLPFTMLEIFALFYNAYFCFLLQCSNFGFTSQC